MTQLIDRDIAIEKIDYLIRKCDIKQWNGAGYMKQILADAKEFISVLPIQQSNEWIDVNDRLPEKDGMYIVYQNFSKSKVYDEHFQQCLHWDGDTWADGDGQVFDVTHWQPLLTPPITNN